MTDPVVAASVAAVAGAAVGSASTYLLMRRAQHLDEIAAFRHPACYLLLEVRDILRQPEAADPRRIETMLRDADEVRRLVPVAWTDAAGSTYALWRELAAWARADGGAPRTALAVAVDTFAVALLEHGLDPVEYVVR